MKSLHININNIFKIKIIIFSKTKAKNDIDLHFSKSVLLGLIGDNWILPFLPSVCCFITHCVTSGEFQSTLHRMRGKREIIL